jgi:hypothetical protein
MVTGELCFVIWHQLQAIGIQQLFHSFLEIDELHKPLSC